MNYTAIGAIVFGAMAYWQYPNDPIQPGQSITRVRLNMVGAILVTAAFGAFIGYFGGLG